MVELHEVKFFGSIRSGALSSFVSLSFLLLIDRIAFYAFLFLYMVLERLGNRLKRYLSLLVIPQCLWNILFREWLCVIYMVLNSKGLSICVLFLALYSASNLLLRFIPRSCLTMDLGYFLFL